MSPAARPPSVTVFRAGPEHALLAARALREVHEKPQSDETAIAASLDDPACYLMLAVEAGDVVGSLVGHALRHPDRREPQFLLYELDVRPAARRRGVGAALVRAFVDVARAAGAFEVWVLTNASNAAAMATYQRCGFLRRNPDDVMLSLALPSPRS